MCSTCDLRVVGAYIDAISVDRSGSLVELTLESIAGSAVGPGPWTADFSAQFCENGVHIG